MHAESHGWDERRDREEVQQANAYTECQLPFSFPTKVTSVILLCSGRYISNKLLESSYVPEKTEDASHNEGYKSSMFTLSRNLLGVGASRVLPQKMSLLGTNFYTCAHEYYTY